MIEQKMTVTREQIREKVLPRGNTLTRNVSLPLKGRTAEEIDQELIRMQDELHPVNYKEGKLSGAVYRQCLSFRF